MIAISSIKRSLGDIKSLAEIALKIRAGGRVVVFTDNNYCLSSVREFCDIRGYRITHVSGLQQCIEECKKNSIVLLLIGKDVFNINDYDRILKVVKDNDIDDYGYPVCVIQDELNESDISPVNRIVISMGNYFRKLDNMIFYGSTYVSSF